MTTKKSFLSKSDATKAYNLMMGFVHRAIKKDKSADKSIDNIEEAVKNLLFNIGIHPDDNAESVKNMIEHIEETYEIIDFDLNDLIKLKMADPVPLGSLFMIIEKPHASAYYIGLLNDIALKDPEYFERNCLPKLTKYINILIKRIENNMCREFAPYYFALLFTIQYYTIIYDSKKAYKAFIYLLQKIHAKENYKSPPLIEYIRNFWEQSGELILSEFLGDGSEIFVNNDLIIQSYMDASNYANDNYPTLIIGETGTGKENIARFMHDISDRSENNFWAVNCGGITESLFNSEIQGQHQKAATDIGTRLGAFLTACGSKKNNTGYYLDKGEIKFRFGSDKNILFPSEKQLEKSAGTLFLDEVNSIPLGLQSKLLRVIEQKEVKVEGEDKARKFDLKIICAINEESSLNFHNNIFRRDFYYRISKGIVKLSPLREMKNSIPDIAQVQLKKLCSILKYKKDITIQKRAINKLKSHDWPGNHRELENILYRGLKRLIIQNGDILTFKHLDPLTNYEQNNRKSNSFFKNKGFYEVEKLYMKYLFDLSEGNKAEMRRLGKFKSMSPVRRLLTKHKMMNYS